MNNYGISWFTLLGLFLGMFVISPLTRWAVAKYEKRKSAEVEKVSETK